MQSVSRAFKENLDISIERTSDVNDIILAQACRHAIVHSGAFADDQLVRQIAMALPRTLKVDLKKNAKIQFTSEEVTKVSEMMIEYLKNLTRVINMQQEN
ncbi:MAG: hypothetical protein IPH91_07595 [Elusimicrobia bacterium]|nr:hypothetical protein [Elusimicrobiota bacterium]MBK7208125.1 hypothetical protein [Elusimicrobiota bacterium]MBK8650273.1 hypothetical protein [Elusimicrobiota bacterium]MBK9056220.1 hypothetical protein [Elusimicrobiota bacterium]